MFRKLVLLVVVLGVVGCGTKTQERVLEAQQAVKVPAKSNFFERQQVAMAEIINDAPNRVFFWYILSLDGKLMTSVTCIGRPASSTESLEPNYIYPRHYMEWGFEVPLEGNQTAYTNEAMGMDGTFGEPVPFRFCITPEGHYFDVTGMSSIVSTIPLTFKDAQADYDQELEAKKLLAEKALAEGKCIDHLLNVIPCGGE